MNLKKKKEKKKRDKIMKERKTEFKRQKKPEPQHIAIDENAFTLYCGIILSSVTKRISIDRPTISKICTQKLTYELCPFL